MTALIMIGLLAFLFAIGYLLYFIVMKMNSRENSFSKKFFLPFFIGGLLLMFIGGSFHTNSSAAAMNDQKLQNEKLISRMNSLTKKNEELQKKYDVLNTQFTSTNASHSNYEKEISTLNDTITALKSDKTALTTELEDEKSNSADLQKQLDTIQSQPVSSSQTSIPSSSDSSSDINSNSSSDSSAASSRDAVYYENCTAARAAGVAPLYEGDPGYASHLDRDHDGIACE